MSLELVIMNKRRSRALLASAASLGLTAGAAPAQPCEPLWSDQFAPTPLSSSVLDLAVFDDGSGEGSTLYAGGVFTEAGHVTVNHIARLDGDVWSPLGSGTDSSVFALESCDVCPDRQPSLYAGGAFTLAGVVEAASIARWDGEAWSPLGGGITDKVFSGVFALLVTDDLVPPGPSLYVGGFFDSAGGVPASNIARWDGSAWSALGSGLDSLVNSLAVFDDGTGPALYAAGSFTMAGETEVDHIARWDGETWSGVGGGVDSSVETLAVFDDGSGPALYVGGGFSTAGGVKVVGIARWDGESWSSVGGGVSGFSEWVAHLLVFDDGSGAGPALYAAGGFETAGEVVSNNIARWDGVVWTALGSGLGATAVALTGLNDGAPGAILYAGGFFHTAGGADAEWVAAWDGGQWSAVTRSPPFPEHEYAVLNDLRAFDDGFDPAPALYVGGIFSEAGGVQTGSLARYDGRVWASPDGGVGGEIAIVRALEVFDDGAGPGLYVGGAFETAGGDEIAANDIARWDGRQWSPLAGGVGGYGSGGGVYALAASDGGFGGAPALYVGGAFTQVDTITANLVARWNMQEWSALGGGIGSKDSIVHTLLVVDQASAIGPALYVGGDFYEAGSVSARSVARWDGESWSALGEGVAGVARALAVYDDGRGPAIYVGGDFETAGGVSAAGIARWSGGSWSSVGGVAGGEIFDLAVFQMPFDDSPALYAGGLFSLAGGTTANSVARYNGAFWTPLAEGVGGYPPLVLAVTSFDDGLGDGPALFAGGAFSTAGGIPSSRIAKWIGCASDDLPPFMPCQYEAQTIGGVPIGINDAGVVSGFERDYGSGPADAFIWTPDSGQEFLAMPPNVVESWAYDVNNAGIVAGSLDFDDDDLGRLAMRYEAGAALNLGTLPGGIASAAGAINEAGQIVGSWDTTTGNNNPVAFIWQGRMVDLGPDLGTPRSGAVDINDMGQVTGWMGTSFSNAEAFIWDDGAVTNIGVIPGGTSGFGRAINNKTQVVVTGRLETGGSPIIVRTFVWQDGQWTDLGVLDGCDTCQGYAISDAGVVVGRCAPAGTAAWRGFIWRDGVMTELEELLAWDSPVNIDIAWAINRVGQIVASSLFLTPIEQPLGDLDGDCRVDTFDFLILLFEWGETGSPADLDGDGLVGIRDLLILLGAWTQG